MRSTIVFDLFAFAGFALLVGGISAIYWPAAVILAGIILLSVGLYGAYGIEQRERIAKRNQK